MAQTCRSNRASCVFDTLEEAIHATEFTTGARAGAVALAVTVAIGLVWWRTRPGAAPLPVAGLATTAAAAYALRETTFLPDRAVLGIALLALAGLVVDVLRLSMVHLMVAAIPGAFVLDSAPLALDLRWVRVLSFATVVVGGTALASFDRRWSRHGLGGPLVALWAAGAYMTLPDTEAALAVLGATLVVAAGTWPLRVASLGACGALPIAGLLAWTARFGGAGRPSSIIGAVACIGLLAVEPATRVLRGFRSGPLDVVARPAHGRWWTLPAAAAVHLVLVFVAARIAGLSRTVDRAALIAVTGGVVAVLMSVLVTSRYTNRQWLDTKTPGAR